MTTCKEHREKDEGPDAIKASVDRVSSEREARLICAADLICKAVMEAGHAAGVAASGDQAALEATRERLETRGLISGHQYANYWMMFKEGHQRGRAL